MDRINTRDLSISVSSSDVYTLLMFYLTIVNKNYVTVTLGWHDSSILLLLLVEPSRNLMSMRKCKHTGVVKCAERVCL